MSEQEQAHVSDELTRLIMDQAQVFASAWSLVCGRFDNGDGLARAEQEKASLSDMVGRIVEDNIALRVALAAKAVGESVEDVGENAPLLTEAHMLCADLGIEPGYLTHRIRQARFVIDAAKKKLEQTELELAQAQAAVEMTDDTLKSASAIAWGWLWHVTTGDDRIQTARHLLGQMLTHELKGYGIRTAKAEGARVNVGEIEAALLRGALE